MRKYFTMQWQATAVIIFNDKLRMSVDAVVVYLSMGWDVNVTDTPKVNVTCFEDDALIIQSMHTLLYR